MKCGALLLLSLALVILPACARERIDTSDVGRLIRALSADSMEGRASLAPGSERAMRFIENEFSAIGLEPLPGSVGFRQEFPVIVVTPVSCEATLNGAAIPADRLFALSSQESLRSDQSGGFAVAFIGKEANVRRKLSEIRSRGENTLVIIAPEHKQSFDRYRSFTSDRSIRSEPDEGPSVVAVLADSVPVGSFSLLIRNSVEVKPIANIAGMIRGNRSNEIVLFSAHYDHLGIVSPVEGDSIANGADDDASGTAAVVALARYFAGKEKPERTIFFVAFAAEEIGGFGSRYFSKQLTPESIVAMCNIEMIGMRSKFGPKSAWITGFDRSSFGPIMAEGAADSGFAFHPDPYGEQNLFYRSDNATLARLGVPAHSISSSQIDQDPYYHTVNDEVETLDVPHMSSVIRGIAKGMEAIISGAKTPTRIERTPER